MIDITQELFSGKVFDGDTAPSYSRVRTHDADGYSLTDVTFCAHNGTHLDAPSHFIQGGKTAELVSLSRLMGCCKVCSQGNIPFDDLPARLLIRGAFSLSAVQAERIAEKCLLIGCEPQSIGTKSFTAFCSVRKSPCWKDWTFLRQKRENTNSLLCR